MKEENWFMCLEVAYINAPTFIAPLTTFPEQHDIKAWKYTLSSDLSLIQQRAGHLCSVAPDKCCDDLVGEYQNRNLLGGQRSETELSMKGAIKIMNKR